jgi:N-acetylmuramoyl-L-alanine amidase
MKKILFFLMFLCFAMGADAQRQAFVKREGGYTNIRRGPGTGYGIVRKERDGNPIFVGDNVGGWYEVYSAGGGFVGYISANKVVFGRGGQPRRPRYDRYDDGGGLISVQVAQEGGYTNLRNGPGTNYRIVGKVRDGSYVYTYPGDGTGGWQRIYNSNGGFRGWIAKSKLWF